MILTSLLILLLLMQAPGTASAAFRYSAEAHVLYDLGLYRGISLETFVPDLGSPLNRETAVVMLLRTFGLEAAAEQVANPYAILSRFADGNKVSPWAAKAVAYGVEKGLIVGLPDGWFGPQIAINAKAYCTLILRQLGFTPDYDNAPAELAGRGGLTPMEAVMFASKGLIRDDLVGISYGTLSALYADGTRVIDRLVERGVLTKARVERAGF
jgi:hypothetical protein